MFMDWRFQTFRGNNFRGTRIPLASIRYSKRFGEPNFRGSMPIREKNTKIMHLESLTLCSVLHINASTNFVAKFVFFR